MKRLFNSSGFWVAFIGTIALIAAYKLTQSELVITLVGGLFSIEKLGKASEDFVKANKGIQFNKETKKHEKV